MATAVYRELTVNYDNVTQYCTAETLELADGNDNAFRLYFDGSKDGYGVLNDTGKDVLFPTRTAISHKVYSSLNGSRSLGSMHGYLEINGVAIHSASFTSVSEQRFTSEDIIADAAFGDRIAWHINGAYTSQAYRLHDCTIGLYFYQYSCAANAAGNGIANAAVSNAAPYQGESVTFTAALKSGATWHGWYSDAECTQLVSTSQSYTTAAADLTLYAKATREVTGTGAYARAGGQWAEAQDVYKKINGEWVLQTDDSYKTEIQNGNYKIKEAI